jgi:hypothetical protein
MSNRNYILFCLAFYLNICNFEEEVVNSCKKKRKRIITIRDLKGHVAKDCATLSIQPLRKVTGKGEPSLPKLTFVASYNHRPKLMFGRLANKSKLEKQRKS